MSLKDKRDHELSIWHSVAKVYGPALTLLEIPLDVDHELRFMRLLGEPHGLMMLSAVIQSNTPRGLIPYYGAQ